jgi:hypothetical protein
MLRISKSAKGCNPNTQKVHNRTPKKPERERERERERETQKREMPRCPQQIPKPST